MKHIYTIFFLLLSFCFLYGCLEDPDIPDNPINLGLPTIADYEVGRIKADSIQVFAKITQHNGSKAIKQGYYYFEKDGKKEKKRIEVAGKAGDDGVITFDTIIGGLKPDTEYVISAFAINSKGENEVEIDTKRTANGLGEVETIEPKESEIKGIYAYVSGEILDAGEGRIEERGIYYSTSKKSLGSKYSPERDSVYTSEEENPFTCLLKDLETETKYYVQAYVKNEFGIYRGQIDSLITKDGKPVVGNLFLFEPAGFTTAKLSAEVLYEGDSAIIARGICWSKTEYPAPSIASDTIEVGNGLGEFLAEIKGLDSETTYYARSFATNSLGTSYSDKVISFKTITTRPLVETLRVNLNNNNGTAILFGEIVNEGISSIETVGFCWSTFNNPSIENDTIVCFNNSGVFSGVIDCFKGGITYYIRAYAINANEIAYGQVLEVTPSDIFSVLPEKLDLKGVSYTPNTNTYFNIGRYAYVLGGDIGPQYTDKLWRLDLNYGWKEQASFIGGEKKWQTSVSVIDELVYVYGGVDKYGNLSDSLYQYWPLENSWSYLSRAPIHSHSSLAVSIGEYVYFIGGYSNYGLMGYVWCYNIAIGWERKTDIPIEQYGGISFKINNVIYAGLGTTHNGIFNNVLWSSSNNCDSWEKESVFPENVRSLKGGVVHLGLIYVVDNIGFIWCYNPNEKIWSKKSQLPDENVLFHCMYSLNGNIYIGLGRGDNSSLIKYNPAWDN